MKPATKITKILLALAAALGLIATSHSLPAQDNYREIGAIPSSTANAASHAAQSPKSATTASVSFSDKTQPGTLKLYVATAKITIDGTDGDKVIVTSTLDQRGAPKVDDDGFRRLDEESLFELVEKNNIATLRVTGADPRFISGAEFKIQVPRSTSLSIMTQLGDNIEIDGIDGDIEISTANGDVRLKNITGAVIVSTVNGKNDAAFKRAPQRPVSLTAMNNTITLAVPPATAANLRLRAMNGAIRTNFPESALQTRSATVSGNASGKRNTIIGDLTGKLNGGGVDIQLVTMNGAITLKQEK